MGAADTKTVMFGATIHLDVSEIAQAEGQLVAAVERKLGNADVRVTIAEVVLQPTTMPSTTSPEDTE